MYVVFAFDIKKTETTTGKDSHTCEVIVDSRYNRKNFIKQITWGKITI